MSREVPKLRGLKLPSPGKAYTAVPAVMLFDCRDAAIAQLLAIGSSRTPVQNQQLRALQLERDFERRATQQEVN